MGLQVKASSFAMNTSPGAQSITGLGFQPKIIFFSFQILTGDGSNIDSRINFGYAISSSDRRSIQAHAQDGVATTDIAVGQTDVQCVINLSVAGAINISADFTSMDVDGFTINVTNAPGAADIVTYLALGGSDLTNVKGGAAQRPTGNGSQSVTGVGFKPDCVILFAATSTVTNPVAARQSSGGFIGWGTGSSARSYTSFFSRDAVATTDTTGGDQTTAIATYTGNAGAVSAQADLTSLDADGFTLNWTTTNATAGWFYYIAMKGCNFSVGTLAQPGSNGQQTVSGLGFIPQAVLFMGADAVAQAPTANSRFSLGAATSSTQRWHVFGGDQNGVVLGSTNASSNLDRTVCIKNMVESHGSPTTSSAADFVNFTAAGGFVINWSATDATARITQYLAIGSLTPQGVFFIQ